MADLPASALHDEHGSGTAGYAVSKSCQRRSRGMLALRRKRKERKGKGERNASGKEQKIELAIENERRGTRGRKKGCSQKARLEGRRKERKKRDQARVGAGETWGRGEIEEKCVSGRMGEWQNERPRER